MRAVGDARHTAGQDEETRQATPTGRRDLTGGPVRVQTVTRRQLIGLHEGRFTMLYRPSDRRLPRVPSPAPPTFAAGGTWWAFTTLTPAPTVSGITPAAGSPASGTVVTITGSGFVPGAIVRFSGVVATGVEFMNSTTITAAAPPTRRVWWPSPSTTRAAREGS